MDIIPIKNNINIINAITSFSIKKICRLYPTINAANEPKVPGAKGILPTPKIVTISMHRVDELINLFIIFYI